MSDPEIFLVELKPVAWLKPYEFNAKKHPDDQVKRLAETIKKLGWDQPIVTDIDGVIIKGHGRRLAAISLGLAQVPVLVRADLTKAQADAARIADNSSASLQYDTDVMKIELARLMADSDFDLESLALTTKEMGFLTEALDAANVAVIMVDTEADTDAQKDADAERVLEADAKQIPLSKALGFGQILAADQRVLTGFMAEAEAATGKVGYDAFIGGLGLAVGRGLI